MAELPKKLLLIGWDAADWNFLNPLMAQGLMPTLSKLIQNGFSGKLASLEPMISPVLWTSLATGVRAYQHGIHGFIESKPDSSGVRPIRGHHRKLPAVWNMLNAAGYRTHVAGWWPSHPAEHLNGVMVSNFFGLTGLKKSQAWPLMSGAVNNPFWEHPLADLQVHPAELTEAILRPFFPDAGELPENDPMVQGVARIVAHTSSIHNAITLLIDNEPWEFAAVYYNGLDHFLHLANHFHPPQLPDVSDEDFRKYHYIVTAACRFFDMMLEQLIRLAGPQAHVLLVSDHGFDTGTQRKSALPEMPGAPALEHQPYGVIAGCGPDWQGKGYQLKGANILDVAPTILKTFSQPVHNKMEGRILDDLFLNKTADLPNSAYAFLPPWHGMEEPQTTNEDQELMAHLSELGYVSLPENKSELKAVAAALRENQYYLAVSLVDGQRYAEAVTLLEKLIQEDRRALRFAFLQIHALMQMGDGIRFAEKLSDLQGLVPPTDPRYLFYRGQWLLSQNKGKAAYDVFCELIQSGHRKKDLVFYAGRALIQSNKYSEAIPFFNQVLELDPEHALAKIELARCHLAAKGVSEALDLLFGAVDQMHALPEAHRLIGQIFYEQGLLQESLKAYEWSHHYAPSDLDVMQKLQFLYDNLQEKRQAEVISEKISRLSNPVVVVSGLPRSGTSMLMQMVQEAGFSVFTDKSRQPDTFNPAGYFEHDAIKRLAVDATFLNDLQGKAVKIVAPIVQYLPNNMRFKVVYIQRPLTEVVVSQALMKGAIKEDIHHKFPFDLAVKLEALDRQSLQKLKEMSHVELLELQFDEVLRLPEVAAQKLLEFLESDASVGQVAAAVNPDLYRNRFE
jgi:predicted AlkP superfamily phosphohydrolase/phosphomutase/tetratricopeptide (TPR) repeat protein